MFSTINTNWVDLTTQLTRPSMNTSCIQSKNKKLILNCSQGTKSCDDSAVTSHFLGNDSKSKHGRNTENFKDRADEWTHSPKAQLFLALIQAGLASPSQPYYGFSGEILR